MLDAQPIPRPDVPPPAASSEATRAVMIGNRGTGTAPEVRLRSALHARGLRFRKHARPLPELRCRADIVFPRHRVAVFVDGCFWHACPEHGRLPRTHSSYWAQKLARNLERDRRNDRVLSEAGWLVLRVWEHEEVYSAAESIAAHVLRRGAVGA